MKVACGQEKSKTGSHTRSHANPRERQALSKGSSAYRLQAARRSGPLAFPCPWARPAHLSDGQPQYEDNRVPPPYLHRNAGCHGDGSQVYRNTCSCLRCFCISADRGVPRHSSVSARDQGKTAAHFPMERQSCVLPSSSVAIPPTRGCGGPS